MKTRVSFLSTIALGLIVTDSLLAQGTAFTYQGRLNNNGAPANGSYDLQLAIFDAASGGFQIGATLTTNAVPVSNGLFTVTLDFGASVFTGANRWLNLAVKTNGAVSFTPLTPPQQITATPYAITAGTVTGVIPAASLSGLYTGPVTMNNPGNVFNGALFAGVFTGNGAGLTGVNASTLGGLSSASFWKTNGNIGANPTNGAFIGTADNLPLEFKVNTSRALRLEPTLTPGVVNVIGGWALNSAAPGAVGVTIAGGGLPLFPNTITASYSTIGGGTFNTVAGSWSMIGGGRDNNVAGSHSTVPGGRSNIIETNADYATIGGGYQNGVLNGGYYATIGGGVANVIQTNAYYSTIGGGYLNTIQSNTIFSTISGGGSNSIFSNAPRGTISGGWLNTVGAQEGTVSGGAFNSALAFSATVGGGGGNAVSGGWATIAGGRANLLTNADYATISGGYQNTIQPNSLYATISGGVANTIQTNADTAVIGGGHNNTIESAAYSAIGGGGYNAIQFNAYDSMIGGGGYNTIQSNAHSSFIGGGGVNTIQSDAYYAVIGGGYQNTIQTNDYYSAIGGGGANTIQNLSGGSVIGGGLYNVIQSNAYDATIGGGYQNTVQPNAPYATIPGGNGNSATNLAFAAGNQAKANHTGAFVWADSTAADFVSTANNQFLIRAGGGVGINKNNPATALDVGGTVTATSFSGSGAGLTGLSAASLSGPVPAAALVNAWQIGGNAGTTPGTQFLGTTDNQALELKVNGARGLRLEPNNISPNLVGGSPVNGVTNGYVGAVIGGGGGVGAPNRIGASFASVLGGAGNTASADYAVAMGLSTTARGLYSTAMGRSTVAANDDATAMGLGCSALGWDSVAMGTFSVAGGHYSLAAGYYSQATNQSAFVWSDSSGIPGANSLANNSVTLRASGGYRLFSNSGSTAGVSLAANGTAWAVISDRNVKKDFAAVDSVQILEKLAAMPITQWHYKWEEASVTPHIGPMAQDFKAAFYPGTDDKSITTQEADGVALAAIQGLNQKLTEELKKNGTEIAELKKELAEIKILLARIPAEKN